MMSVKLLVLSNVQDGLDRVVDFLASGNSVVAKERKELDSEGMAEAVCEELGKGTYDLCIVVAKDPIRMGMMLNKADGVSAAVCGSAEDVRLAKEDRANAIVLRDAGSEDLGETLAAVAGQGWSAGLSDGLKRIGSVGNALKRVDLTKRLQEKQVQAKPQQKKPAKDPEPEEEEKEEKDVPKADDNRSFLEKLKDDLGIVG